MEIIPSYIIKRDGSKAVFDRNCIERAITKALIASNHFTTDRTSLVSNVTDEVCKRLTSVTSTTKITVELCQDLVEEELVKKELYLVAKAYILYRQKRAELRNIMVSEEWKKEADKAVNYFPSAYQYIVYLRTYSKFIEEKGRRETWPETVERFMSFMKEVLAEKLDNTEYQELEQAILTMQVMPSMRMLQFAGEACRRNNICAYNCAYTTLSRLEDFRDALMILMCGAGVGFSVESKYIDQLPIIKPQSGNLQSCFIVGDSREGWCEAFYAGLKTWYDGQDINFDFSNIRPYGARLKTTGGRASGPAPLKELLDFTRNLILENQNSRLSTINVHDLMCKIGKIVVVGGVRRSSEISLSDLKDREMQKAKNGMFWKTYPDRAMANNSAVYNSRPSDLELMKEWFNLAKSGSGERGIFNRTELAKQLPARRLTYLGDKIADIGTNPCVTGDMWIMTEHGPRMVKELIGQRVKLVSNGTSYDTISNGFYTTGYKAVFLLTTQHGFELKATIDHPLICFEYGKKVKKQLKDLTPEDYVLLSNHGNFKWPGLGNFEQGWLIAQLVVDKLWITDKFVCCNFQGHYAVQLVNTTIDFMKVCCMHDYADLYFTNNMEAIQVGCDHLTTMVEQLGFTKKGLDIEKNSYDFYLGFLRGIFDRCGVIGNFCIDLPKECQVKLKLIQQMLLRVGIISKLTCSKLSLDKNNLVKFQALIDFSILEKRKQLQQILDKCNFKPLEYFDRVKSVNYLNYQAVYDVSVDKVHEFCLNGIRASNCGEIYLLPYEFCNLSTVVARVTDDRTSLLNKIRLATIIGTYQSLLTDVHGISPEWKDNIEAERLLGVSITGQRDCSYLQQHHELFEELKQEAIRVNCLYSERFGITASKAITTTKPEGTTSEMLNTSSGVHPRYYPYYIRRLRMSSSDPLAKLLIDQKVPHAPENGQSLDCVNTWVFEFPQKSPKGSIFLKDLSAIDQLEYWKVVKTKYTEHNPSCTINIKRDEWITTLNWLTTNWDIVGGLSFLPYNEHVYQLAPMEEISREKYKSLKASFPKIDFSRLILYEKKDTTEQKMQWACQGNSCKLE